MNLVAARAASRRTESSRRGKRRAVAILLKAFFGCRRASITLAVSRSKCVRAVRELRGSAQQVLDRCSHSEVVNLPKYREHGMSFVGLIF